MSGPTWTSQRPTAGKKKPGPSKSEVSRGVFTDSCADTMRRKRRAGSRHWADASDHLIALVAERMAAKYHS